MRPAISSMTASSIGWLIRRRARSEEASWHWSSHFECRPRDAFAGSDCMKGPFEGPQTDGDLLRLQVASRELRRAHARKEEKGQGHGATEKPCGDQGGPGPEDRGSPA